MWVPQSANTARRIRRSDSTEVRYLAAAAASRRQRQRHHRQPPLRLRQRSKPTQSCSTTTSLQKAAQARTQATRADMQKLLAQLDGLPTARRPAQRTPCWRCCKTGWASPVCGHRAHRTPWLSCRRESAWWSGRGGVLSTVAVAPPAVKKSAPKAAPSKAVVSKAAPAQKASGSKAPPAKSRWRRNPPFQPPKSPSPNAGKTAQTAHPPTAAQVARVRAGQPSEDDQEQARQRSGLLKHIEAQAAKTEDPAAMAQRVLSLLEARKDVVIAADGKGITYSEKK